jgi:hypothetical protein
MIWASLIILPVGSPAPEGGLRTDATSSDWECWLLPAMTNLGLMRAIPRHHYPYVAFVVAGVGEGLLSYKCRNASGWMPMTPASDESKSSFDFSRDMGLPERFIKSLGPRGIRRAQVETAMRTRWPSHLEAVHGVLASLKLVRNVDFRPENYLAGHRLDDPALPAVFRSDARGSGVRAMALDHQSSGWARLVSTQDLYDYGEPPCLVRAEPGGAFIASDPPVSLQFGSDDFADRSTFGGMGEWVDVPIDAAATIQDFASWSRQHVGEIGRGAEGTRRPLRGEVPDEPQDRFEQFFQGWRYRLARRPTLRLALSIERAGVDVDDELRSLLNSLRTRLLFPVTAAYEALGGQVATSRYGTWGQPNEMLTSVVSPSKGSNKPSHPFDYSTDEWDIAVKLASTGLALHIRVEVCDPTGFASGLRLGRLGIDVCSSEESTSLVIDVAQPFIALAGGPGRLVDIVRDSALAMPISLTEASYGRTSRNDSWLSLLSDDRIARSGGHKQIESSDLFTRIEILQGRSDPMTLLRATDQPDQYSARHAQAVADLLEQTKN